MIRLTEVRIRRGWSQSELARRAHINAGTVSLVESGRFKPYPAQIAKIARALGHPADTAGQLLEQVSDD